MKVVGKCLRSTVLWRSLVGSGIRDHLPEWDPVFEVPGFGMREDGIPYEDGLSDYLCEHP